MGHGRKMGQTEFDCACVFVVFTCIPLMFHGPYIKAVGLGHGSIGLPQVRFFFDLSGILYNARGRDHQWQKRYRLA